MTEMKHSPGPWAWRWKSGALHRVGTTHPYGETVLYPSYEYDSGVDTIISQADASLIAAAPEMFAALISARRCIIVAVAASVDLPEFDPAEHVVVREIDTAIARARGETP